MAEEKIEFEEGIKPVTGIPSNYGDGGVIRELDDQGHVVNVRSSGAPLDTRNIKTPQEVANPVRMGDYYYAPNRSLQVWKNSPTDLKQRFQVAVGGTAEPANTVSLKNEGLGTLGGAVLGSLAGPAGAIVGGLIGGLSAHNTAAEEALEEWRKQNVKYDTAVEFYKADDGSVRYKLDYEKMGTGGPRSGEGVKEAQDRETKVSLGDDGHLKITVSPIFASTERFQELANYISENYGGLSKDTENLDEVLTEIKNGIDGEAKSFITNMKLYADFANRFPNATPETIVASYTTEIAGYVDPEKMGDYQVSVLDGDNIVNKSAKDFFNSVLGMDKGKRNELVKNLNEIVYGENDLTDDKRAIAYGELQSLFTVSANIEQYDNNKYQGMMDADPFVSWLNNFAPLGLSGSDVVSFLSGGTFSKQEYLSQNDFAEFLGGAMGIGAGLGLWKGGTKLAEEAFKRLPGSAQLFNASVSGQGRAALREAIVKGETGKVAKMWGAEVAFKGLKIGAFDAALAGAQSVTSGKDFWAEFGQDLARDITLEAIFSYYDMVQYQKFVNDNNVYVYTDPKTGNYKKLDVNRGESFTTYELGDDGLLTEVDYKQVAKMNVGPSGEGETVGVLKTPQGTTITVVDGKIKYEPGKSNVVEGFFETTPTDGIPSLSTGVVVTDSMSEADILRNALEREGPPLDTKVTAMPSQQADAAIVAGKIAKIQGTKAGGKVYEQLFSKNGYLDMANNLALARDGDLNAWRSAQEDFVSVSQKADDNLRAIQNGAYIKSAAQEWQNTLETIGGFNYEYKYKSKTDGTYINAINQIQRAQLLNNSRVEGDTTDYVAKALEKYGDTISNMPQERAEALQKWLEQGKKWLKVFNQSVRKSGKVDVKLLDSFTDTDIESEIGYFPVWAKKTTYKGLLDRFYGLEQKRNPYKEWLRDGEWVPLEELEDPYTAMTRYMGLMTNNMGLNDRNETTAKVLERADLLVDNTPTDATIRARKLKSVKNKDELLEKLDKMVADKKKEVKEKALSPKQYNKLMVDLYNDSAIEDITEAFAYEPANWEDLWQKATNATRKDIRDELEKTSLQTGYGISDTRARLNAQVPGADVLDWSLLGRNHTNGLAPGGLYAGKENPVKAYIMSIDDLVKLTGYDLGNTNSDAAKEIEKHINTKDAVPMLPAHIRGSGDGPEIWLKMRWGHNSDSPWHWGGYLKTLKERGIEKVPVAIDDARGSDFNSVFYQVRNSGIAQKGMDNMVAEIDRVIASGEKPNFDVRDISAALHLSGMSRDRLRKRIRRSIPSSAEEGVSYITNGELEDLLDEAAIYDWADDAELNSLADNIENVVKAKIGYVPQDITADVQQAFSEYGQIPFYRGQSGLGQFNMNELSPTGQVGDAYWIAPNASYTDEYGKDKIMGTIPIKYFMSDKEKNNLILKLEERNWELFNKGYDNLSKKEKNEYDKIIEIIEPRLYKEGKPDPRYGSQGGKPEILSYRALAEYAKKPIIDISEDGFANGTAYFYYKGVSPEFDKEVGQQLATQANLDMMSPRWTGSEIARIMDDSYSNISLGELLENVYTGTIDDVLEEVDEYIGSYNDGEISSEELSKYMEEIIRVAGTRYPGTAAVMKEIWDNVPVGKTVYDMKFKYWNPTTGQPNIDDETAGKFLEEMGEAPSQGSYRDKVPEGQLSLYDMIKPSVRTIPNQPEFKQPNKKPSYEDYQKGIQADPSMAGRIEDSYRAGLSRKLVREASRTIGLAEDYLSEYAFGMDWQSYLNTSLIPDIKEAINQRMLPEEFKSFIQARMAQAIQDVAPYQSPELVLKGQLDNVAEEWREWAEKHIKAGRASSKELKDFADANDLKLIKDKRPLASKIKHALWERVEAGKRLPKINGLDENKISKDMDKEVFYKMLDETPLFQSATKDKKELVDLIAAEKNSETTDGFTMGVSASALGLGGRYPIQWYKNGKPYTRFIKYDTPEHKRWAESISSLLNDKELIKEEGLISRFFSGAANDFRLLTTGWDPARVFPNVTRDTSRSFTVGTRFINAKKTLQSAIEMGNYTPKQKEILNKAIEDAAKSAASSSYNSAYRSPKAKQISITKEYLSATGANKMKRFMYNLAHDKRAIAEGPMEFFEGYSRRNNARSLAAVQLGKDQGAGLSFEEQLQNAVGAATFAGREYTANFQRKGKLIGAVSKYVAYQSSAYAGLDGMMRAFIDNPKLVARNFAVFVIAYLVLLADTLSREETRNQYLRLSEYDRENQIVIGMGDSILTIPMDQELAGLLFPYRRIMETLNGVDPVSFFEFVWGTLTDWMPTDLSGFSEGDGFNLSRGLEKLTAQNMPTALTPIQEAATGYDLYYGNNISVSDEDLEDRGIYNPQPGDYTTAGKDSLFLRNVANITGIPQWQLQAMWNGYGGNVGKYVLNTIDKVAGATKDQQGGKEFADTVFNSFTALDQDAASSAFYSGLDQLKKEKGSLLQKISKYNEDLKTASGDTKIELQNKIQKAKEEYGTKVGDFVNRYVNAYDLTGGLPKKYAQQIYYLFRLDDDDTIYESGSPEEYYNNKALQRFKSQATALSAPILDKYYNNRIGNIYQDTDGVWRRYLSGGAQAMKNSIYGHGEEQMVDLLNILEGKDSTLVNERKKIKNARNKAYEAKDWTTREALGYELDKKVVQAISPYIEKYGAENVLGNSQVLDYLADWFIVPDDFIRTKKGKYVSLGNSASTQEAFVRPYIKYVFGLPTNYSSYKDAKYNSLEIGK